jgi:TolB-like protein/Tfp pilus assembly protein PilF
MDTPAFEIRTSHRDILIDGAPATLGARAFDVLAYLHMHKDRVVSKQELLEQVWGGLAVEESNLTVQISALRKLLGQRAISTVPGVGYQLTTPERPTQHDAPSLPDKPSLAVLPFANLTGAPDRDYLVDGVVTELTVALSRIPAVFVISASSTFALRGRAVDLTDVGRRLGVSYILDGGVQQAGDQLRITTQLIEAETGHTIWSERFSGLLSDLFDLQDRMAEQVAAVLEPNLLLAEYRGASAKPATDLHAYDLCLRVIPQMHRLPNNESFLAARSLLERALALDPGYTRAKALVCRLTNVARSARWMSFDQAQACLPLAEDVVADPGNDALALAFAGHAIVFLGMQQQRGAAILKQAIAMNPNSAHVLNASGWVHSYADDQERAIEHFTRALRLNPLDPIIGQTWMGLGWAIMQAGRLAEGLATMEQAYAEAPEYTSAYLGLTWGYWHEGRHDEARTFAKRLLEREPGITIAGTLHDTPYQFPRHLKSLEDALRGVGIPE